MTEPVEYQRLSIYLGESDQHQGRPLWQAVLEHMVAEGLAGATALRGLAGFGAHSRIRTASLAGLSAGLPVVVVAVDRADKIGDSLPSVSAMVPEGLITIETVHVVKYSHRDLPSIPADRRVADAMTRTVVSVGPDTPLSGVATALLSGHFSSMPVIDPRGKVVGIVSDGDLLRWPELTMRLRSTHSLVQTTAESLLQEVGDTQATTADVMTAAVVTVRQSASLAEAAELMVLREVKTLPVVDDAGILVGMLSRIDVLRAMMRHAQASPVPPASRGELYVLRDIMRPDVPIVLPEAPLAEILDVMLASDLRRVLVVDELAHPIGVITDGDVVARVGAAVRPDVLRRLVAGAGGGDEAPTGDHCASQLMSSPLLIADESIPIIEALRLVVEGKRRWVVVVDADGRLAGMADRRALLRALLGGTLGR